MPGQERNEQYTRSKRQKHASQAEVDRAAELERDLFGADAPDSDKFGRESEAQIQQPLDTPFAFEDRTGAQLAPDSDEEQEAATAQHEAAEEPAAAEQPEGHRRRPVWQDPGDQTVKIDVAANSQLRKLRQAEEQTVLTGKDYQSRLRQQHVKLHPRTSWASLKRGQSSKRKAAGDEELNRAFSICTSPRTTHKWLTCCMDAENVTQQLLGSAGTLLGHSRLLPPHIIEAVRVKDANQQDPSRAAVQSVEFHPSGQLLMTAGLDKRLRLFQVDGVHNPKADSVCLEDMPVRKAAFVNDGAQIVASGRRRHFYIYDVATSAAERVSALLDRPDCSVESFAACSSSSNPLVAFMGNEGSVPLVSLRSRQSVGALKMNGTVRTAAFTSDGANLLTSGSDGVVHTWDLRMRRCRRRDVDEGCINSASLVCSRDGRLFASGSGSGVVNVYSRDWLEENSDEGSSCALPAPAQAPKPLATLMNLTTMADSLTFSPDSQMLAMASRMKRDQLRLVHVASGTVFQNWPTSRTPLGHVHSLCFSPQGAFMAIGNAKGCVLLYRMMHYDSF